MALLCNNERKFILLKRYETPNRRRRQAGRRTGGATTAPKATSAPRERLVTTRPASRRRSPKWATSAPVEGRRTRAVTGRGRLRRSPRRPARRSSRRRTTPPGSRSRTWYSRRPRSLTSSVTVACSASSAGTAARSSRACPSALRASASSATEYPRRRTASSTSTSGAVSSACANQRSAPPHATNTEPNGGRSGTCWPTCTGAPRGDGVPTRATNTMSSPAALVTATSRPVSRAKPPGPRRGRGR